MDDFSCIFRQLSNCSFLYAHSFIHNMLSSYECILFSSLQIQNFSFCWSWWPQSSYSEVRYHLNWDTDSYFYWVFIHMILSWSAMFINQYSKFFDTVYRFRPTVVTFTALRIPEKTILISIHTYLKIVSESSQFSRKPKSFSLDPLCLPSPFNYNILERLCNLWLSNPISLSRESYNVWLLHMVSVLAIGLL